MLAYCPFFLIFSTALLPYQRYLRLHGQHFIFITTEPMKFKCAALPFTKLCLHSRYEGTNIKHGLELTKINSKSC